MLSRNARCFAIRCRVRCTRTSLSQCVGIRRSLHMHASNCRASSSRSVWSGTLLHVPSSFSAASPAIGVLAQDATLLPAAGAGAAADAGTCSLKGGGMSVSTPCVCRSTMSHTRSSLKPFGVASCFSSSCHSCDSASAYGQAGHTTAARQYRQNRLQTSHYSTYHTDA